MITLHLLNEALISEYLAQFSKIVQKRLGSNSIEAERDYVIYRLKQQNSALTHFYAILDYKNNLIGAIEIRDRAEAASQLYIWINEVYWGKGYAVQAIKQAAHVYFKETEQKTIQACVDFDNEQSIKALKKAGFAHSGILEGPRGKQYKMVLRASVYLHC